MNSQESDYEYRLFLAVNDIEILGLRASAKKHSVKLSTLRDRCAGASDINTSHQKELSLSPEEKAFQPLTRSEIRAYAEYLLEVNGQIPYIGKNWVDRFFTRHSTIKKKPTKVYEAARKRAVTRKSLSDYYNGLQWVVDNKNITRHNTWNVDENGMQLGETRAGIVAGTVMTPRSEVIKSDNSTWVSIIECISAGCRRLTPCVVFTGKNLQGQWFPSIFPSWKYQASPSGWSNSDIFIRWFIDVFIPETTPSDPSQWRLLVLDQHKSHITPELMKKAWVHKIWLSWLPSHSSHITQPLDVAAIYEATSPNQQKLFLQAYKEASIKAISQRNIRSGFLKLGIFPINLQKAIEALKPRERERKGFKGPTTPRRRRVEDNIIWNTPQGSADIRKQQEAAQSEGIISIRDFNYIIKKMIKSIDNKNSQIQRLKEEKAILKASAAAKEPTGRVPVQFDPNAAFPSIDNIISARDQAERNILHNLNEKAKKRAADPAEKNNSDTIYVA
uniref:HTH CENPB-type domain-containing protein n=1 Tax=Gibberella zeae TaxID=5518 RepID=A0A4E9E7R9_GIBZA